MEKVEFLASKITATVKSDYLILCDDILPVFLSISTAFASSTTLRGTKLKSQQVRPFNSG